MFIEPFKGVSLSAPPLWLMRQAGRTLPEYHTIRRHFESFLDLVLNPEAAAEITLQPIKRFGFDAAIFFADILVIPFALGQHVEFVDEKGPVLGPLNFKAPHFDLSFNIEKIASLFETLSRVRKNLSPHKALIGFAGSPWTVAAYMIEGQTSKTFSRAKRFAFSNPYKFQELLDLVTESTFVYLTKQVEAGATALQLFESWGGCVPSTHMDVWVFQPTLSLVKRLKNHFPKVPIIGFPRGLGSYVLTYVQKTGVDGVSLDAGYSLETAKDLPCVLQGNLDPHILVAGGSCLERSVKKIKETLREKPFIFNLGHGLLPETPLRHIEELVCLVKDG